MAKVAGRKWVDGTEFHFVGPDLVEWYYVGTYIGAKLPTAEIGEFGYYTGTNAVRYVDESGDVREIPMDTGFGGVHLDGAALEAGYWHENGFVHWITGGSGQEARGHEDHTDDHTNHGDVTHVNHNNHVNIPFQDFTDHEDVPFTNFSDHSNFNDHMDEFGDEAPHFDKDWHVNFNDHTNVTHTNFNDHDDVTHSNFNDHSDTPFQDFNDHTDDGYQDQPTSAGA